MRESLREPGHYNPGTGKINREWATIKRSKLAGAMRRVFLPDRNGRLGSLRWIASGVVKTASTTLNLLGTPPWFDTSLELRLFWHEDAHLILCGLSREVIS